MKKGSLLIDSSTIDPSVSKEMAAAAEKMGAVFMDAPVSGGTFYIFNHDIGWIISCAIHCLILKCTQLSGYRVAFTKPNKSLFTKVIMFSFG